MNSAFTLTLLLSLLVAAVYCNHDHHNNHGDDKWITFVSQIESFWKTETPEKSSEIHTESTLNNKDVSSSDKTTEGGLRKSIDFTTNPSVVNIKDVTSRSMDNADMRQSMRNGLAGAIVITIVGVIVLIGCCCCIIKGGCGMCRTKQEGRVIVSNSNMMYQPPVPQPTQVIVQPPIYQQVSPPQQVINQYPHPPHMQYGQQQFQQHGQQQSPPPQYCEFPEGGIENPNFYHPSAPLHSPEKY